MTTEFERATAVRRRGDGVYEGEIAGDWDIGGNANGGYLIALAARAMADAVGRPPLTLTAHYVSPGKTGPVDVEVDVVRAGRRTATVAARLRSVTGDGDDPVEVLALLGTFGEQAPGGPRVVDGQAPEVPPFEDCVPNKPPVPGSGFGDRVRSVMRPEDAGYREGRPSGTAEVRGWFSFPDTDQVDAFGLLLATDAFAPVVFNRAESPVSWAPTLELTVHIRGLPAPGPLRCAFRSRFIQDGLFEEDGEIWDASDRLVAQSRQLALIPRG